MKKSLQRLLMLIALGLGVNINTYALVGTYTIGGASPNYTTLSAAINAVNLLGVTGDTKFLIRSGSYSGANWQGELTTITGAAANARITFEAESGNPADVVINVAGTSSANYIVRLNKANYVTFKNLTFTNTNTSYGKILDFVGSSSYDSVINCRFNGAKSTTSGDACAMIFATAHTGTDLIFYKNVFTDGSSWAWIRGTSTASWTTRALFIENSFNMTNSGYYGLYLYYASSYQLIKNTFSYTGSSTFYGVYSYYTEHDLRVLENTFTMNSTSTLYPMAFQFFNYASSTGGSNGYNPSISKNVINATNTSGTTYPFYNYYCWYTTYTDNIVNSTTTTGSHYPYNYYNNNYKMENNTFNFISTSSGSLSGTYINYNGGNYPDTIRKNKWNIKSNGGSIIPYWCYYGNTIMDDNEINLETTTNTIQNYFYYANGFVFANNKIRCTTTTGTIYGMYSYTGSTSYTGSRVSNNDFDLLSTSTGYHYQYYGSYVNGDKIWNNVVTSKSNGPVSGIYLYSAQYNGNRIYNNVFHVSSSTLSASNQYGLYADGSGEFFVNNNIISRSTPITTGYGVYVTSGGTSLKSDYNLYDMPGGTMFYHNSYNGASLNNFRAAAKIDYNSLVYKAPYVNGANRNFAIDASSQDAWAVNGRGIHDSTRYTDRAGAPVPLFVTTGVPDIGAYEVTPTSTPPDAVATPANPVANSFQVFTFGQDTVLAINWGATVPATYTVKQYTGIKATPVPTGLKRMFFYIDGTPSTVNHDYMAYPFYKNPWIGDIPTENDAVMARKSGAGGWVGYNYTNAQRDINRNIVSSVNPIDSAGSFTVVENGRIGIRCVYPPTGIRISNITAVSADFTWDAIFNPLGYQVIVKKTSTPPTAADWAAGSNPTSNSVTVPNLTEDTKYYVFVRNICDVKDTSGHTMDSFQTIITCHAPTIKVVDVEKTRAIVYWDSVRTAIAYEWALTTTSTPPAAGTAVNKLEQMLPYLDQGKKYYIHVRANCNTIYAKSDWTTAEFNTWAVGIQDVNMAGKGMHIYPNPVKEELVVMLNGDIKSGSLTVVDMTGKQLQSSSVSGNEVTLNVNALPAGVYILQYADEGRREQMKFTKQ